MNFKSKEQLAKYGACVAAAQFKNPDERMGWLRGQKCSSCKHQGADGECTQDSPNWELAPRLAAFLSDHCAGEQDKRLPGPIPYQPEASTLAVQVGGNHYKDMPIQPVEYIYKNGIGYFEGCVIKYVSRWKKKNGLEDLKKARHFLDLLIELEGAKS